MNTISLIDYLDAKEIFNALESTGAEARFVGGCVRDALIDKPLNDIDIATPLLPEQVINLLEKYNIRTIATGLKHGTVTAIINHQPYEITTLRRDIETDGRRAVVEYTDNWLHDAERRDFTINAMSCNKEGKIFDYFDGYYDLKLGIVKFVGQPEARIKEDYLRILRFFRFHSYYSNDHIDLPSLVACSLNKEGINILSGERIQNEMYKLLCSNNYYKTIKLMHQYEVLQLIIPRLSIDDRFMDNYNYLENLGHFTINPLRRLAALCHNQANCLLETVNKWKLSNKDKTYLNKLAHAKLNELVSTKTMKQIIRLHGKEMAQDLLLLKLTYNKNQSTEQILFEMLELIASWTAPIFPLGGNDLLKLGLQGSKVGRSLALAEQYWESNNYTPTKDELLSFIQQNI